MYGEELSQRTAIWWSPDGRKLAYYRFDEQQVPDYYVALEPDARAGRRSTPRPIPKPGAPNPIVDLFVYDVATKQSQRVDVRGGKPFDNAVVGHYVYHVEWSRDGRELLFFRTQPPAEHHGGRRGQSVDRRVPRRPARGVADRLADGRAAHGVSRRRPALHLGVAAQRLEQFLSLRPVSGTLIAPLTTSTTFEAAALVKIDEAAGVLFYTARDGDNPLKLQLHRVGLDGTGDRRLTDPAFHHTSAAASRRSDRGRSSRALAAPVQHLAGQQVLRRRLPDARHAAGDAAGGRRNRHDRRGAREERHDEVHRARLEEGGAVHVHGRRRHDDAARPDPVSVDRSIRPERIRRW